MAGNFVTEVNNQHASTGVDVTNVNGDIFNTTIYVVDSDRKSGDFMHLARLF